MQRTFTISLTPAYTDPLIHQLRPLDEVIALSLQRGSSVKPSGDVLTVQVLNAGADEVLRRIERVCPPNHYAIASAELTSMINPAKHEQIRLDVDEAIWEEMESGLRYHGRLTGNFIALMALGGGISAVGLVSEPGPQTLAFVAASIIAPGFEPLAKVPLGLILKNYQTVSFGLRSSLIGYGLVCLGAILTFLVLQWLGVTNVDEFTSNSEVDAIANPTGKNITVSLGGTLAGCIIVAAYRRSVIAGALIAMVVITAMAMVGVSLACGRLDLAWHGLQRTGIDVGLIILTGTLVFGCKQWFLRRRKPLV
ncbi:DUF389 domain-containing protein [Larkinella insperata]|uniref:DUF389 domain-containing protein n=1 Tax=Larkinella insperata TaxID=332158 RepID=A0ABW3QCH8_9BACT|nr:DUF389 domain-containing protein [Larkinella insperata]